MQFWGKNMEMLENTEMLNLQQQKREEIIQYQNQIVILQTFHRKVVSNSNDKNSNITEYTCLFRFINIRSK